MKKTNITLKPREHFKSKRRLQSGMSLVELMISMVVGLFLLAGVVTNFISTKDSEQMRRVIGEMDANAQYALKVLRQNISHAGYTSTQNIAVEKAFYTMNDPSVSNPTCRDGLQRDSAIINMPTRDKGRADRITVISLADNPCIDGENQCADEALVSSKNSLNYTDCSGGGMTRDSHVVACSTDPILGMPNPRRTEAKIFSTFYVKTTKRELHCTGSRGGGQPITDNVYAMQFLYGVKQDNGQINYKGADAIDNANPPEWGMVRSVQVALLMQSTNPNVLDAPRIKAKDRRYTLLDRQITTPIAEASRLFRVYSTTINLENLNKEPLR